MNGKRQQSYNYLDRYLTEVRAQGRYAFTVEELQNELDVSLPAIRQNLFRLRVKNGIAIIRQGFYVIIPPEYSKQGMLPPYLFIDDLMKSLDRQYYVGLLSAAALHGAAHQQPTGYTVITQCPAPRNIEKLKIIFFSKQEFLQDGIIQKNTPAGYINVSSPELTALDFFNYNHKFGINRITTVLQELSEEMKPSLLLKIARQYPNTTAIQRLGYILDKVVSAEKLADKLCKVLNERTCFPVALSPQKKKTGEMDTRWRVIKNMEIESDL
jgi:predicted transcriptional regulator of viral defense system